MTDVVDAPYPARRERLRAAIGRQHPGRPLLVTDLANVRYLTGFTGSNAVVVIGTEESEHLIGTDGRYVQQVAEQVPDLPSLIDRDTLALVARSLAPLPVVVESSMSVLEFAGLRDAGLSVSVSGVAVEEFRKVKDAVEIDALRRACAITAAAFDALSREIVVGSTELALARRLEQLFGELGAEDRAFDSIVAAGAHGALPHHGPGQRPLQRGDLLVIDAGARVDGYHADMTRTYVVGADPEPWQAEIHGLVATAQAAATAACLPGADLQEIDAAARSVIAAAGFGERYNHGLGHGVGLAIHEAPMIGPRSTGTMGANMAITAEPGIYLAGRGGVRIEDTLVVTDAGPWILTEAPRGLGVVG